MKRWIIAAALCLAATGADAGGVNNPPSLVSLGAMDITASNATLPGARQNLLPTPTLDACLVGNGTDWVTGDCVPAETLTLGSTTLTLGGTTTAVTGLASLGITAPAVNTTPLTISGYSLTGSNASSMLDLSGTWNTTGTPTAFDINITDTASNAASLLFRARVGASEIFTIGKIGTTNIGGTSGLTITPKNGGAFLGRADTLNSLFVGYQSGYAVTLPSEGVFSWSSVGATGDFGSLGDLRLYRGDPGILEQRNAANAQSFRAYNTYTDASNYERAVFGWTDTANVLTIGTQHSNGVARNIDIVVGGVRKLDYAITTAGVWTSAVPVAATNAVFSGSLMVGSATALTLTDGAVGMQKITASASAPGAAGGKMELVCGTNAGTAKLVIAAGTSGTASTILDNIGAGVTGC